MANSAAFGTPLVQDAEDAQPTTAHENMLSFASDSSGPDIPDEDEDGEVPFQSGICGQLWLTWVARGILRRGQQASTEGRQLNLQDLYRLPAHCSPALLSDQIVEAWRTEVATRGAQASVLHTVWCVHYRWILGITFAWSFRQVVSYGDPLFVNRLIDYAGHPEYSLGYGLFLACCFFGSRLTYILLENLGIIFQETLGTKMRTGLVSLVLRKLLIMRQDAFLSFSTGKMNNLITTDVDKANKILEQFDGFIVAPLRLLISLVALHHLFGLALYFALIFMIMYGFINAPFTKISRKRNEEAQKKTDERVRLVGEAVQAIQIVKCYAWEHAVREKIAQARQIEIKALWRTTLVNVIFNALASSAIPLTTLILFTAYTILFPNEPLTTASTFTAVSLLDMLQASFSQIPYLLTNVIEAKVSAQRLQHVLSLPEATLPATEVIPSLSTAASVVDVTCQEPARPDLSVCFSGSTYAWPPRVSDEEDERPHPRLCSPAWWSMLLGSAPPTDASWNSDPSSTSVPWTPEFKLADLAFKLPHGALVAIVGSSASGKSSVLQSVLGEMPALSLEADSSPDPGSKRRGQPVDRSMPIAFVPQKPWIFNGTVRQNILFGTTYNAGRYMETIESCDLVKDFDQLRSGDGTLVGEKGVTLSGGQKARLCLARAVYRRKDCKLYVLDDPYGPLDAHTAQKVHEQVVLKKLKSKTRLVVTNRLEFISSCDLVIVLRDGLVQAIGPYSEVRACDTLRNLLDAQGVDQENATADGMPPQLQVQRSVTPQLARQRSAKLGRQVSGGSVGSAGEAEDGEDEQTAQAEEEPTEEETEAEEARASGNLDKSVLLYYVKNMGGAAAVLLILGLYVLSEGLRLFSLWWLSVWTSQPRYGGDEFFYLGVFVFCGVSKVVMQISLDIVVNVLGFKAATQLHGAMFASLLRAPLLFFQDTPHGRIINRFSKDTAEVDRSVIRTLCSALLSFLMSLGSFCMVGFNAWYALLVFSPLVPLYYYLQKLFNRTMTEVRRLSKVYWSPVYDQFNGICRENGLSVVRAFHALPGQMQHNNHLLAQQMRCPLTRIYVEMWYYQRMEPLGALLLFLVSLFVAFGHNSIVSAGSAALALSLAMQLIYQLPWLIRMSTELTITFNCVERVLEYTRDLPAEKDEVVEGCRPPASWPSTGSLEVKDLQLRYKPDLPCTLKGLTFNMKDGERIGIVGRTGAGKSTLLTALFRIVEPETGSVIRLDGLDVLSMGLQDLRKAMAMIPQDSVMFEGSLRYNCDPFQQHADETIWQALEEAQFAQWLRQQGDQQQEGAKTEGESTVSVAPDSLLEMTIQEGGQNMSAGQRNMISIARAVLRRSKFVVLDEATAALDPATDGAIQRAIRRCFHGASTLTIAHRIGTIIDSDRILVLDKGEIAEFGPPEELRKTEDGIFKSLVDQWEKHQ